MNDWVAIALLVILLAGNAFFVAGEFAIMSTRRAQIEPLAEEGNRRAQTVIYALENVSLMLATCQLGITICSLLILNVSEPALHHMLEVPLHLVGLPHAIVDVIAFGITLILVTYLHVIFRRDPRRPRCGSLDCADPGDLLQDFRPRGRPAEQPVQ